MAVFRTIGVTQMFNKTFVVLLLTGTPGIAYAQVAPPPESTPNQNGVAAVLNAPIGVPTINATQLQTVLIISDPVARADALAQLAPQAYSLVPEVSLNAIEAQETNIGERHCPRTI
jgi:hypothetical protein